MKKNLINALKKLVLSFGGEAKSNNAVDLVDEFADVAAQDSGGNIPADPEFTSVTINSINGADDAYVRMIATKDTDGQDDVTVLYADGFNGEQENTFRLRGLELPKQEDDAANKQYVDDAIAGAGGGANILTLYAKSSDSMNLYTNSGRTKKYTSYDQAKTAVQGADIIYVEHESYNMKTLVYLCAFQNTNTTEGVYLVTKLPTVNTSYPRLSFTTEEHTYTAYFYND